MKSNLVVALSFALVASLGMTSLTGCATSADDEEEQGEKVESTGDALQQGGCSMSEIRGWQGVCRDVCDGNSAGIHYCYPGMSMRHANPEGACACR